RDEDLVVVRPAVAAVLILPADAADDGVRQAVQVDARADALAAPEELCSRLRTDDGDAVRVAFVGEPEGPPALDIERPDLLILRLDPVYRQRRGVVGAPDPDAAAL